MDRLAEAYRTVRDTTLLNKYISSAEAITLLELVKVEIVQELQDKVFREAMTK